MCGILLYLKKNNTLTKYLTRYKVEDGLATLVARGPEGTNLVEIKNAVLGFTRLAINGLTKDGMQPMEMRSMNNDCIYWVCNGEIYNYKELQTEHQMNVQGNVRGNVNGSDCSVLGPLYEKYADTNLSSFFRSLDGVFAIALIDTKRNRVVIGRDPYGVRPLYLGKNDESLLFASEMKAINTRCNEIFEISHVLPGTYQVYTLDTVEHLATERYHTIPWVKNPMLSETNGIEYACMALRVALEEAVLKRLMTERPVAALLSGGVDSSLIAALVARELKRLNKPPLKTFCIGMPGSTDIKFAKEVADWIGSDHTEIIISPDDFFQAIPNVIQDIESFDTTTVRASVGNWLVSREIKKQTDCKVVFNGDGSDEIFGSYLYFKNAPSDRDFEDESNRLLQDIYMFDVLRSDRSISSHGLEPRTPFLDKQFVAVALSIGTSLRRPSKKRCEKWILRKAFDDGLLLPSSVLWRKKEAFSDGVSSMKKSWYQEIQERVLGYTPFEWKEISASALMKEPRPQTQEQYYYRMLYHNHYGDTNNSTNVPYFWMPKWSPGATDPSARTLAVYS